MLLNIFITCPVISTFISNCYFVPARLFVMGNKEKKSNEDTAQGNLTAMGAYALGAMPLLCFFHEFIVLNEYGCREVVFADDFSVAWKIKEIKTCWEMLQVGPLYGYFPKPSKSNMIVKEKHLENTVKTLKCQVSKEKKKEKDIYGQ